MNSETAGSQILVEQERAEQHQADQDRVSREKEERDRRRRHRFDIECELRYRLLDSRQHLPQQTGKTINFSSKGILFETTSELPVGKRVELSIAWPALLNEKCRLKMVAVGKIVRAENGRVAAVIQKHEFRTQGALLQ